MYGRYSIETIKKYVPDVKLIAILRQPAERLYSRFLHLARVNKKPTKNFSDLSNRNSIWWKRADLINEGFYYKHLKSFFNKFNTNQLKILFYDDFKDKPDSVMKDIFMFLNVNPDYKSPNTHVVFNKSGYIKSKLIHRIIGPDGMVFKNIKKILPGIFKMAKQNNVIYHKLIKLRSMNLNRPVLDIELKRKITQEIYLEDIKDLERLIKTNLEHWYEF